MVEVLKSRALEAENDHNRAANDLIAIGAITCGWVLELEVEPDFFRRSRLTFANPVNRPPGVHYSADRQANQSPEGGHVVALLRDTIVSIPAAQGSIKSAATTQYISGPHFLRLRRGSWQLTLKIFIHSMYEQ